MPGSRAGPGDVQPLTAQELDRRYAPLLESDPVLRAIAERVGRPDPFRSGPARRPGEGNFAALVLHVVAQQISTAVALVLLARLEDAAGGVLDPGSVAALGTDRLRAAGLSHAKAVAVSGLAAMHLAGTLDTDQLDELPDEQVVAALTAVPGIGPWTAQMFLIDQLHRQDVLPAGDLGIRSAVQRAWTLADRPTADQVRVRGEPWTPLRTFAAALLWSSLQPPPAPGRVT